MDKTNCAIFINWIQKKQTIDKHNRWISKKLCYMKEVKHKRLQIIRFQWYEIPEKQNHTDRKQICSHLGPGQGRAWLYRAQEALRMAYLEDCGSYTAIWASQVAQQWRLRLPTQESWAGSILGSGNPLEKEMATHFSILAWKNLMGRGTWQATVHRVAKESGKTERKHHHNYSQQK